MSAGKMLRTLWQIADAANLKTDQLDSLCQSEDLALHLENVALIMDRVAALTYADNETEWPENRKDVSAMLWGLSSTIETLAAAVHVAGDAGALLAARAASHG